MLWHFSIAILPWGFPSLIYPFYLNLDLLYCPAVFGHFLDPPENHLRGAIFPTVDEINQSIKRRLSL